MPATIDPAEFEVLDGSRIAEVVVTYAHTVYAVCHQDRVPFMIGESPRATFAIPAPTFCFPLTHCRDGAVSLRFTAGMRGEVVQHGRSWTLPGLIDAGLTTVHGGSHEVVLGPDDHATIQLGAVGFAVRSVPPGRNLARRAGLIDRALPPHLAFAALIILGLMYAAFCTAPYRGVIEFDRVPDESRFVGYFAGPAVLEPIRERHKVPRRAGERFGFGEYTGEQGQLGKPTVKARRGRLTLLGPTTDAYARNFDPERRRATTSLLGLANNDLGGFLAQPHAMHHDTSHADEHDLWGARDRRLSESYGIGGLGVRGTGRSAGGDDTLGGFDSDGHRLGGARRHTPPGRSYTNLLAPLTTAEVRRVLRWQTTALRRCGPLGPARVHFTITGAGRVDSVRVDPGDAIETRAADCVARRIRRAWFPRGLGRVAMIYPLPSPSLSVFPPRE